MRRYRWREISIVFQGAMNALNPVRRVGDQIAEPIEIRLGDSQERARKRAGELLELVGIPRKRAGAYPARAVGRHAPAGDDRDGPRLRPGHRHRRRADDRARRHGPGPDPRAARAAPPRARAVADPHHPRPVGHRRDLRPGADHVRRQGGRGGPGRPGLHRAAPSVHAEAARRLPEHPCRPADARRHPGVAARPARPAPGLPVPPALSGGDGGLHARSSRRRSTFPDGVRVACHLLPGRETARRLSAADVAAGGAGDVGAMPRDRGRVRLRRPRRRTARSTTCRPTPPTRPRGPFPDPRRPDRLAARGARAASSAPSTAST